MKRIIQIALSRVLRSAASRSRRSRRRRTTKASSRSTATCCSRARRIPASRLVAAAYGFICAAVVVWVASVARRARRLEDEVDELKKKIEARG